MSEAVPVSVVVPTIGRIGLLRDCVASIVACRPRPAEVLVVDQSGTSAVADELAAYADAGVRVVPCEGRGIGRGTNLGLREAANDIVAVTHDDCRAAVDWVGVVHALAQQHPGAILTGAVRPLAEGVPSSKASAEPEDYTGRLVANVLYPANMVASRSAVLALGGFDERPTLALAAEDNDLCYRWLKAGGRLRYEPSLVVFHEAWRSDDDVDATYRTYGRGTGAMYAKHLRQGDLRMLRFLAKDVKVVLDFVVRRKPVPRKRTEFVRGIGEGMRAEWRRR